MSLLLLWASMVSFVLLVVTVVRAHRSHTRVMEDAAARTEMLLNGLRQVAAISDDPAVVGTATAVCVQYLHMDLPAEAIAEMADAPQELIDRLLISENGVG